MSPSRTALLGLLVGGAVLGGLQAQDKQTATLKFKAMKSFKFVLPKETWTPVRGSISLGGNSFRAVRDGLKLSVDTNGTGSPNKDVKGSKGYLVFLKKADGQKYQYAARFKGDGKGFSFASSCALVGSVGGVPLQLVDLNNNGRFDEVGRDGVVVGKGKAVTYLSKVISHGGKLFNLEVDGNDVSVTPHDGEVGTLNLTGGFKGRGRLESAIVSDGNGNHFNVAGSSSGVVVPVGNYRIVAGSVSKGSQRARIRGGKMRPVAIKAEKTTKIDWGGQLMVEFNHALAGGTVSVAFKNNLKFYGTAGEEYYDWYPNAKSPKMTVRDPESGKALANFIFDG